MMEHIFGTCENVSPYRAGKGNPLMLRVAGGKHRLLLELNLARLLCECARVTPEDGAAGMDMSQ